VPPSGIPDDCPTLLSLKKSVIIVMHLYSRLAGVGGRRWTLSAGGLVWEEIGMGGDRGDIVFK
jgi:hypothetical protein